MSEALTPCCKSVRLSTNLSLKTYTKAGSVIKAAKKNPGEFETAELKRTTVK